MMAIDDSRLHEWAEFNLPAELLGPRAVLSPLARRVLAAPPAREAREAVAGDAPRATLPNLGVLLMPRFGLNTLPKS